jgi:outer membrane protein assembly factor BamB
VSVGLLWVLNAKANEKTMNIKGILSKRGGRYYCNRSILCVLFVLVGLEITNGAGPAGVDDDWPRYGHDGCLTGRSPLKGNISSPQVAWSYSLSGKQLSIELIPSAGEHKLAIPGEGGPAAASQPPQYSVPGPELRDLDGSGTLRPAVEKAHERWGKLLPEVRGLQRVAWSHTWILDPVARLQLFAYDQGHDQPRMVWETDPPEGTIFSPLNIVYDIDGDGVLEICTAAHYRIMIFEGTTGRKETELKYHQNRPYGWFGLFDLDDDGQRELITIGDFQSHIDVLKYDPSKPEKKRLRVLWRRDIERDISERKKWPQVGPRPVVDVTGDGRPEIVINLYNHTGDQQWHTLVHNALTGDVVCDLAQRYLQGVADVDNDGLTELFLTATDEVYVPTFSVIELVKIVNRGPAVIWSHGDASWAINKLVRLGKNWSTSATDGMKHVVIAESSHGHGCAFAVRLLGNRGARVAGQATSSELVVMRYKERGKTQTLWRAEGLIGQFEMVTLAESEKGNIIAVIKTSLAANTGTTLIGHDAIPRIVSKETLGLPVSSPIAARLRPNGPMVVISEGAGEYIFAIKGPSSGGTTGRLLWQHPGRGMSTGSRYCGPLAADLNGDGGSEVIVADQAPHGYAVLNSYRHDGGLLWSKGFEQTPGKRPVWNIGAITFWWPGHFRGPDKVDLFVNGRRGHMHSDFGYLVDGKDGKTIWSHKKAIAPDKFQWGYAGIPLAIADITGDECDELINLYPVCFWVANGRDGKILTGQNLAARQVVPAWAAYGEPIIHDFTGLGRPQVLLDCVYILALLDSNGLAIWHGPARAEFPHPNMPNKGNVEETTSTKHALVDFDGDGRFEIASAGYGNRARAIDPSNGKVLWSVDSAQTTCSKVSSANIDGVGGDEMLYIAGDKLIAISGDRSSGRILWTWQGPAALSLPAIADVDGDGLAEIILQDANGTIHCLDCASAL